MNHNPLHGLPRQSFEALGYLIICRIRIAKLDTSIRRLATSNGDARGYTDAMRDDISVPDGVSNGVYGVQSCVQSQAIHRRSRLGSVVIEALECLRSWLQIQDTEADLIVDIKADIKREQQAREKEELGQVEEAMIREDNC
ncbi:hypothetical protein B0O99DRAFT_642323 [Bisporella sp. PMI_857]|nr:hypothetical protein B0O99DRAFT_642323 [Bisporella sp. PMI_857]